MCFLGFSKAHSYIKRRANCMGITGEIPVNQKIALKDMVPSMVIHFPSHTNPFQLMLQPYGNTCF